MLSHRPLADNYSNGEQGGSGDSNGTGRPTAAPQYTIPGILHYLQYEWHKFEFERQQWDTERAELKTQLCILKGEVVAQMNLKKDLVRRIKMLEYCLRQERCEAFFVEHNPASDSIDPDPAKALPQFADLPVLAKNPVIRIGLNPAE